MGSEAEKNTVEVEGITFPTEIAGAKPLFLLANGLTDIEIHFLQIKYNAIGIYLDKSDALLERLEKWKGKKTEELAEDDAFFESLVSAPVEKMFRVVVIKEIKGSQYGVQLESSVRDRLVAVEQYEDDEEEALEKVTEFFQSKYFKPNSVITFHFPTTPRRLLGCFSDDRAKPGRPFRGNTLHMIAALQFLLICYQARDSCPSISLVCSNLQIRLV